MHVFVFQVAVIGLMEDAIGRERGDRRERERERERERRRESTKKSHKLNATFYNVS